MNLNFSDLFGYFKNFSVLTQRVGSKKTLGMIHISYTLGMKKFDYSFNWFYSHLILVIFANHIVKLRWLHMSLQWLVYWLFKSFYSHFLPILCSFVVTSFCYLSSDFYQQRNINLQMILCTVLRTLTFSLISIFRALCTIWLQVSPAHHSHSPDLYQPHQALCIPASKPSQCTEANCIGRQFSYSYQNSPTEGHIWNWLKSIIKLFFAIFVDTYLLWTIQKTTT